MNFRLDRDEATSNGGEGTDLPCVDVFVRLVLIAQHF